MIELQSFKLKNILESTSGKFIHHNVTINIQHTALLTTSRSCWNLHYIITTLYYYITLLPYIITL